ncbi:MULTISPECIES: hypothetical protein [unclassified Leptolyngbya]|uniref:hypothetical protein n=1 Tax=unclassified Leptolyngbya TaxID=2650499 RepID=UPI0016851DCF|nr:MULTISPECIES: hypothetical protein [unclassified Leptolyngbya]MBD1912868.1 hypothetical protein [Leptolyngbya sp. FACHB-8]MBD2157479.1 hypothetical protein [Leptolyngbya sp. FACHB-16]
MLLNATRRMILKIKTVAPLMQGKWEFRHGEEVIKAETLDPGVATIKVPLVPGDALDVEVQVATQYDYNHEVVSTRYTITKVNAVLLQAALARA